MGFFDDFAAGLESYPDTEVTLKIVDVNFPGDALNESETGNFKIKVTNNGPLTMQDVKVQVTALNGAQVSKIPSAGVFSTGFVTDVGEVPADGGTLTTAAVFGFKAPSSPSAAEDLIKISLDDWTADLTDTLANHSVRAASVSDVLHHKVVPV